MTKNAEQQIVAVDSTEAMTINMSELETLLDWVIPNKKPICIWGVKAVGKTTSIAEAAKKHGRRLVTLHLATQDIIDLIGTPTNHEGVMSWSRPEWLHDDGIPTVYFLDEFNRGNKFVMAAMLPFLNEGKMHSHCIGEHDVVIAACNPSTGSYQVNDAFEQDEALRDRCGHVILKPTNEEWINYATGTSLKTTLSVISKNEKWIDLEDFKLPFTVKPSRRSLINIMSVMDQADEKEVRKYGKTVIGAYLGTTFLNEWFEERFKNVGYLTLEEIQSFSRNKSKITTALQTYTGGQSTVKNDIFEASVDLITSWFNTKYRDGTSKIEWLFDFFSIPFIPKDSFVSMMADIHVMDKPVLLQRIYDSKILDSINPISDCKKFAA